MAWDAGRFHEVFAGGTVRQCTGPWWKLRVCLDDGEMLQLLHRLHKTSSQRRGPCRIISCVHSGLNDNPPFSEDSWQTRLLGNLIGKWRIRAPFPLCLVDSNGNVVRQPRNQGAKATKLSTDNIGRIAERDVGQTDSRRGLFPERGVTISCPNRDQGKGRNGGSRLSLRLASRKVPNPLGIIGNSLKCPKKVSKINDRGIRWSKGEEMGGGGQSGSQGSTGGKVQGWRTGSQGSEEGRIRSKRKGERVQGKGKGGFKGLGRKVFGTGT